MRVPDLHFSRARFVFVAVAVVLVASLLTTYSVGNAVLRKAEERTFHEEITRQLQQTFSTLQDAETGQRGFLLSQRAEYLAPYDSAIDEIATQLRRLHGAAERGGLPPEAVASLERATRAKIAEMARSIQLARQEGFPAAVEMVNDDLGRKFMDEIRASVAELEAHEKARIEQLHDESRWLTNLRTATFLGTILLNFGFLAWAFRRIRREMAQRFVADLEAQRHRDILAVSLASIGDAVIITDTHSVITFLNDVALELTGWTREAAMGQPCSKVFRIVNETTRAVVESPVEMVLRTGKIVGLANHTLLIRRDGSEVPIDDSGAPVREADGTVRGVILVFRDFSHYKRAEQEQKELKRRLEVANKAKDDFIAALSHELRTPLTPVLATLSTWESGVDLPEPLAADVQMLTRNVRLEVRLIDDLLDLTRIARGKMTLHRERADVHALLGAVVEIFRADLERRQVRLGVRTAAARHWVDGDPTRLQQVFWNLLGNAVKHTPDGGRIEIVTANEGDNLRVTFADNGHGMSPQTIEGLFRPFERVAETPAYRGGGGLGIGLSISQSLMEAHGGRIEARSAGEGLGSSFVVVMPVSEQASDESLSDSHEGRSPVRGAPLSLLLLEDHRDSADVIARILRSMGHAVEVAHTVQQALTVIRERSFDLVLSDIGLPDGTGIDFLTEARTFTDTPMIALTGYGMEDDVANYREAGFLRQLTKPIRFEQLSEILESFAASRGRPGGLNVRSQPPATDQ
jgi:PAS domain S-box-containing protein